MSKIKEKIQILVLFTAFLFMSACLSIHVSKRVDDPSDYFEKASKEIARIHKKYPDRDRRPRHLPLLVYDKKSHKLVRISTPLWVVNGCIDIGMMFDECDSAFDYDKKYDFEWEGIRNFRKIGGGLLVEVDSDEDRILIWLK